jgi:hypothetical protein
VARAGDVCEEALRLGAGGADAVDCGEGGSDDADDLSESDESEVDLGPPSFSVFKRLLMSIHCFRTSQAGTPAPATHTSAHLFARRLAAAISRVHAMLQQLKGESGGVTEGECFADRRVPEAPHDARQVVDLYWGMGAWSVARVRGAREQRGEGVLGKGMTDADEK